MGLGSTVGSPGRFLIPCDFLTPVRWLELEKGVQNGSSKVMGKGKACENRTKEGPRTRVRTSGKTNCTPG